MVRKLECMLFARIPLRDNAVFVREKGNKPLKIESEVPQSHSSNNKKYHPVSKTKKHAFVFQDRAEKKNYCMGNCM